MTPRSEVVRDPAIMSGDPTVQGTRILAETILAYLRSNAPEEEIRKDYPSLPADGIEAVTRWAEVMYGQDWRSEPVLPFSLENYVLDRDPDESDEEYPWLQIECSRCRTPNEVDLVAPNHPPTTCVHDLAGRLRCEKCKKAGKRPPATLLQLAPRSRYVAAE